MIPNTLGLDVEETVFFLRDLPALPANCGVGVPDAAVNFFFLRWVLDTAGNLVVSWSSVCLADVAGIVCPTRAFAAPRVCPAGR